MSKLPRSVILLGLVSLFNDAASDMIAPLLPIFLTVTLGADPAVVGPIEGVAETTSSLVHCCPALCTMNNTVAPSACTAPFVLFHDDLRCSNEHAGDSPGATLRKSAALTARFFIGAQR